MSDTIIKVEGLGKKYIISHEGQEKYTALRDVISRKAKNILQKKAVASTREEFWALKDVNFEIKKGEAVGIIGRNGAGKSTLLKILSRITEPSHGRIEINGRVASLLEVGTGFHPELTGRENIYLNGAILGMSRAEIKKKFDEIVDFSGVEKFLDTPVKRYSSGMYVRLAFAVAAHLEPEILVVDEVLAVGDAEFQKKCLGKMSDVSKNEGRTVLFVSHNMAAVKTLCKEGIFLANGKISKTGLMSEVLDFYLSSYKEEGVNFYYRKKNLQNKDVELIEAGVFDYAGQQRGVFEINENINVRFTVSSLQKVPNIYLYVLIKNEQEEVFVESDSNDLPPNIFEEMGNGEQQFAFQIRANVLPVGRYLVYFNFASSYSNRFDIDSPGDILRFEVRDTITKRGVNRKALTGLFLKIEKI